MPVGSVPTFEELFARLHELFELFMSFGAEVFKIFTYEVDFGDYTFSLIGVLFGLGFIAWVLWKALPLT